MELELRSQVDAANWELEERDASYRLLHGREGMLAAEVVGEKRRRVAAEERVVELEGRVVVLQTEVVEVAWSRVQEVGELEGRLRVLTAEVDEEKRKRVEKEEMVAVLGDQVSGLEDKVELLKTELREEKRSSEVKFKEKDGILDAHRRW